MARRPALRSQPPAGPGSGRAASTRGLPAERTRLSSLVRDATPSPRPNFACKMLPDFDVSRLHSSGAATMEDAGESAPGDCDNRIADALGPCPGPDRGGKARAK